MKVTHLPFPAITLNSATAEQAKAAATLMYEKIGALPGAEADTAGLHESVGVFESAWDKLAYAAKLKEENLRISGTLSAFTNGAGTISLTLSLSVFPAAGALPAEDPPAEASDAT